MYLGHWSLLDLVRCHYQLCSGENETEHAWLILEEMRPRPFSSSYAFVLIQPYRFTNQLNVITVYRRFLTHVASRDSMRC